MALLNEYHKPATIAEAIQLLGRDETRLVPLAGGTRLVGELETRARRDVDGVVDLSGLGLAYIHAEDDELCVGAMTTVSDLIAHDVAADLAGGLLRRVARYEGPVNLRNAATVGGIVAAAEPDSELYAALLALEAKVVYGGGPHPQPLAQRTGRGAPEGIGMWASPTGGPHPQPLSQGTGRGEPEGIAAPASATGKPTQAESVSLHDPAPLSRSDGRGVGGIGVKIRASESAGDFTLNVSPGVNTPSRCDEKSPALVSTALNLTPMGVGGEGLLITEIRIPLRPLTGGHARIARTPMDRPIVAAVAVRGEDVERVVLCGVAARPILDGEALNPVSDFKGSAEYRREMAAVVRRRALAEAKGG